MRASESDSTFPIRNTDDFEREAARLGIPHYEQPYIYPPTAAFLVTPLLALHYRASTPCVHHRLEGRQRLALLVAVALLAEGCSPMEVVALLDLATYDALLLWALLAYGTTGPLTVRVRVTDGPGVPLPG